MGSGRRWRGRDGGDSAFRRSGGQRALSAPPGPRRLRDRAGLGQAGPGGRSALPRGLCRRCLLESCVRALAARDVFIVSIFTMKCEEKVLFGALMVMLDCLCSCGRKKETLPRFSLLVNTYNSACSACKGELLCVGAQPKAVSSKQPRFVNSAGVPGASVSDLCSAQFILLDY